MKITTTPLSLTVLSRKYLFSLYTLKLYYPTFEHTHAERYWASETENCEGEQRSKNREIRRTPKLSGTYWNTYAGRVWAGDLELELWSRLPVNNYDEIPTNLRRRRRRTKARWLDAYSTLLGIILVIRRGRAWVIRMTSLPFKFLNF